MGDLAGQDVADAIAGASGGRLQIGHEAQLACDVMAVRAGDYWLVQFERSDGPQPALDVLGWMDEVGTQFEKAGGLAELCQRAADAFSALTGYDRVMIYRFLDDDSGVVVAETVRGGGEGFRNHHFPASDIPQQARALYVRNRVRVIADVHYEPQPIQPAALRGIDLSDVELRSVSPIHIQYLKNMGVGASASVSIVRDGLLWGLVACHNRTPRALGMTQRRSAQLLAGGLARQVAAKEEAERYRDRIRVHAEEDTLYSRLTGDKALFPLLVASSDSLRRMFDADSFAVIHGSQLFCTDLCPEEAIVREIADWARMRGPAPYQTHELPKAFPAVAAAAERASGLLSITLSTRIPTVLLWFRAEEQQIVEWAGNPHKAEGLAPGEALTPRASFVAWREILRGKARPWSAAEVEGAHRLIAKLYDIRQNRRIRDLAESLTVAAADKDRLLEQKDTLIKEVNHRVQNSIQLVIAFLALQARDASDATVKTSLEEAQRRLSAVALVHRRLYADDNVESINLSRYLYELLDDLRLSMGPEWSDLLTADLAPVMIAADNAVNVGLILVELVINAQKYAYAGAPGPVSVVLEQHRARFRLIVADRGKGRNGNRQGFGSRMLNAMVKRLSGTIEDDDNQPGLRVIFSAPIAPLSEGPVPANGPGDPMADGTD
ncbi:phytochrome [Sphingobium amiense]|uniref:Phytochrome n=1 Tax=Sphingobium amiense TaxID=135719 RepID=A0A494WAA4_9SPHN|nr:phytochrome [Sphingobium amiense]